MKCTCEPFNLKMSTQNSLDLCESVRKKIILGEELLQSLEEYENLDGIEKVKRKISQELVALEKASKSGNIKKEHLQCTHQTHYSALVKSIRNFKNCKAVCKTVMLGERKITIDMVCDDGLTWVKIIAKNQKSLSQISTGDTSFGVRSVLDQAQDYTEVAKLQPFLFQIPKIIFVFVNGVGNDLIRELETCGVTVEGTRLSGTHTIKNSSTKELSQKFDTLNANISLIEGVNLDVSTMIAYVCSVCNGSAGSYQFSIRHLNQQSKSEQQRPLKPILNAFLEGKKLYCCQTAKNSFINIVNLTGGPREKTRAEELLQRITVLPDDAILENATKTNFQMSLNKTLLLGGKIKEKSSIIFKFGDRIGAVTMTSNDAFVRAAKQQGIDFVVFLHESRALTEQTEVAIAMDDGVPKF